MKPLKFQWSIKNVNLTASISLSVRDELEWPFTAIEDMLWELVLLRTTKHELI
jgi:hypothetical protein